MRYRFETFGGIIASEDPPMLAFVDRDYMRGLDLGESDLWRGEDESVGVLSAPTEVHLAVTNACPVGCRHCYMGSTPEDPGALDTADMKRALDELAAMGVFHVAMGGGEALVRPDLFELAEHARRKGLVPNLTVSGALMDPRTARRMKVFGQVNVSLDGVGEVHAVYRGSNLFERADRALDMLIGAGVPTGINCVVGGLNYGGIPDLFEYAAGKGVNEIEFLRLKPSGRGALRYEDSRLTDRQHVELVPMLRELSERHGIVAKIDCSFIPMLCEHSPPPDLLEAMATYGCEAGNVLLGIRSDGRVNGCSFLDLQGAGGGALSVFELRDAFATHPGLERTRNWAQSAPEPCRSCEYLRFCKGGCRAVAAHVTGDELAPDPECPRVVRHMTGGDAK